MVGKIKIAGEDEAADLAWDARLVALRWDLSPYDLIFDLDSPISEAANAPYKRAWLIFYGMHEISWDLDCARLPTGCWLTSAIGIEPIDEKFKLYRVTALTPKFLPDDSIENGCAKKLRISAMKLIGLVSERTASKEAFGLSWETRNALASDEEMLLAAKQAIGDYLSSLLKTPSGGKDEDGKPDEGKPDEGKPDERGE